MKKRLISLLLVCLMAAGLITPALAYLDYGSVYLTLDDLYTDRMAAATQSLTDAAAALNFDFHADIVNKTDGYTLEECAAVYYEKYEYGYGEDHSGSELMILIQDNGATVDLSGYALVGGGSGEALLQDPACDGMREALDSILNTSEISVQEAGDLCASAIEIYQSTLSSLLSDGTESAAAIDGETAADSDSLLVEVLDQAELAQSEDSSWLIRDFAGLLTESQQETLEAKGQDLMETYGCNTYVLTVDSMDGLGRRDFAKQYYLANDLGNGAWRNGILFLVAMDTREYVTITYGRDPNNLSDYGIGINAFSDYGIAQMENKVVPELSDGDYYEAFDQYLTTCGSYLKKYTETGEAFDVGDAPKSKLVPLLITILIPLAVAAVVCMIFRSQMKTAVTATQADNYIPNNGFNLTHKVDQYTHTTQTRRTISRDSDSGGGGSSVDSGGFGGSSGGHF